MGINPKHIVGAQLFIDDTGFIGLVDGLELPENATKMIEHKATGMIGAIELPMSKEKATGKFKVQGLYEDLEKFFANAFASRTIMIMASLAKYDASSGVSEEQAVVITMTGMFVKSKVGTIEAEKGTEGNCEYTVWAYKLVIAGTTLVEWDILNNKFEVNGVDIIATRKSNMGVS